MAKKATAPVESAPANPPTTADNGEATKGKPGRKPGFSTKSGDLFKANEPQPEEKVAPQAKAIANIVAAAGTKGITREKLVKEMEGVVQTRQPQARILSYYQKTLVEKGFFTVTPAEPSADEGKSESK